MSPRLFWSVLSVEARKLMSYRADFWANTLLGTLSQFALAWILWAAILNEPGETVEGYTLEGIVMYYALVLLLGKLVSGPQNPTDISQEIYDGSLSRYLLAHHVHARGHSLAVLVRLLNAKLEGGHPVLHEGGGSCQQALVLRQGERALQPAGEHDGIEGGRLDLVPERIRHDVHPARTPHLAPADRHQRDLQVGPAQGVDERDGLELLEAVGDGDEDARDHGAIVGAR